MSKNEGLTMNQLAEINAQHVTTIAALEAKCAALAAENAALKESEREFDKMCAEEFGPDWVSEFTETPATDAFLAEVRAQGVEMYAEHLTRKAIASGENKNHAYAYLAANFASQLRQGAAQ